MPLNEAFFKALTECTKLERLCIIAKQSVFQPKSINFLMEQVTSFSGQLNLEICCMILFASPFVYNINMDIR